MKLGREKRWRLSHRWPAGLSWHKWTRTKCGRSFGIWPRTPSMQCRTVVNWPSLPDVAMSMQADKKETWLELRLKIREKGLQKTTWIKSFFHFSRPKKKDRDWGLLQCTALSTCTAAGSK